MSKCGAKEEGAQRKKPGVTEKSDSYDGSTQRSNTGRPVNINAGVSERQELRDTGKSERLSEGGTDTVPGGKRQGARGRDEGNVEESHGQGREDQKYTETSGEQEKHPHSVVGLGQYTDRGGKENKDKATPREQEKPKDNTGGERTNEENKHEVTAGEEEKHKVTAKEEGAKLKETAGWNVKQIETAKEDLKQKKEAGQGTRERAEEKVKQIETTNEEVKQKDTTREVVTHKETAGEKVKQKQTAKVGVNPVERAGEEVKQKETAEEKAKLKKTIGGDFEGATSKGAKYQDTFVEEVKLNTTLGKEVSQKEIEKEIILKDAAGEGVRNKETAVEKVKQKETAKEEVKLTETAGEKVKQKQTAKVGVNPIERAGEGANQKETAEEKLKLKKTTGGNVEETTSKGAKYQDTFVEEVKLNVTLGKEVSQKEIEKGIILKDAVGEGVRDKESAVEKVKQKETAKEEVKRKETAGKSVTFKEIAEKEEKQKETAKEEVKQKTVEERVELIQTAVQEVTHKETAGKEVKQNKTPGVKETQAAGKGVQYQDTIGEEGKHKNTPGKKVAQKDLACGIEVKHMEISGTGHKKQEDAAGGQTKQKETLGSMEKQKGMNGEELTKKETTEEWKKCKETTRTELAELENQVAGMRTKETATPQEIQRKIAEEQKKDGGTSGEEKQLCETSVVQEQNKNMPQQNAQSVPLVQKEPETAQEWLELCDREWVLRSRQIPLPDSANCKQIYKNKPFGRNFLKSPNPEGLSTSLMPPQEQCDPPPQKQPLETLGNFSGWKISTEEIPVDRTKIPPGVVVCYLPIYSWCVKEQMVDLLAEGLWPELLDIHQPHIYILDWYEDSKLHKNVYELHVKLLAEDNKTIIAQHDLTPENDMSGDPKGWNPVSHIFKSYGSGVRYVHFMHKSKDLSVLGFHRTRVANSSLFVNLHD
ncbi:hypothetical protein XELAEV_18039402mg [Xenopus laevis]|uniref:FBA domain-containing protein n=1 Tax=Xenopus laevis TaxID=8355 RepID=A0A974C8L5_XENLA|nr:hypothetical protein XELAEV_18039402mg [Xenopus laevis]